MTFRKNIVECELVPGIWDDISRDVWQTGQNVSWRRGISGAGPKSLVGDPGTMRFTLDNSEWRYGEQPAWLSSEQGRYSPGGGRAWKRGSSVFKHGTRVRLRCGINYGYRHLVLAMGAIGYYRMDGESSAANLAPDLAGSSTTGTYSGGVTPHVDGAISGDANLAARFDGTDDEVTFLESVLPSGNEEACTLIAWVKTSTTAAQGVAGVGSVSDERFYITIDSSGFAACVIDDAATEVELSSGVAVDDGEWHMIVAAYDNPTLRIYVDGALAAEQDDVDPWEIQVAHTFNIGRTVADTDWFTGDIDEVAVFASPLSESQVLELYQSTGNEVGAADMVLFNNPVAYYRLGETSGENAVVRSQALANASWIKTNSSIEGNVSAIPGRISATADAIVEDGTNGQHLISQTGLGTPLPSSGSVFARVKVRSRPGFDARNCRLLLLEDGSNFGGAVFNLASGTVASTADNGNITHVDESITDLGDGWYACYIEVDQTSGSIAQVAIYVFDGASASYTGDGESGIEVGEVQVWATQDAYVTTTASPIGPTTTAVDQTGSFDGTYSGGYTLEQAGALADGDTAANFDGVDGLVTTGVDEDDVPNTEFSMGCWFRGSGSGTQSLISRLNATPRIGLNGNGDVFFQAFNGSTTVSVTDSASPSMYDGDWHFAFGVYDGSDLLLYVDGVFINSASTAAYDDSNDESAFLIGDRASGGTAWDGDIDEVAFFDYALTATQIAAIYAARLSEYEQGAGAIYYPFLGKLTDIEPQPDESGTRQVHCTAVDWMGELQDAQAILEVIFNDPSQSPPEDFAESTQAAWNALITAVDKETGEDNVQAGDEVVMIAFDDLGGERASGRQVAQSLAETDLSLFYARGNDGSSQFGILPLGGQTLEVLPPSSRASQASSPDAVFVASELRKDGGIVVPSARERVVNDVTVRVNPPRVDSSGVIATINRPLPIKQGVTFEIWVDHKDPTNDAIKVGANNVVTPTTPADYLGNSQSDGGGTDRSSELDVTATPSGSRTLLQWSVNSSNNVWARGPSGGSEGPQLRGEAIVKDSPLEFTDKRQDSIDEFGQKSVKIEAAYNFFPEYAIAMAESIADTYEDLTNVPTMIRPQTGIPTVLRKALGVTIGSGITVSEVMTGVDEATVIVYGEEGEISSNVYRMSWQVAPPLDTTPIDDVEFGID